MNPCGAISQIPLAGYFFQVGYVVPNIETACAAFGKNFGVTFSRTVGAADPSKVRYKGKPTDVSLAMAFAHLRGFELEIIQPLNENNIYTDFLAEHGPGLHHVGFKIPDYHQYRRYYDLLLESGNAVLMEGRVEGKVCVNFCYFDCSAFGASTIELIHYSTSGIAPSIP